MGNTHSVKKTVKESKKARRLLGNVLPVMNETLKQLRKISNDAAYDGKLYSLTHSLSHDKASPLIKLKARIRAAMNNPNLTLAQANNLIAEFKSQLPSASTPGLTLEEQYALIPALDYAEQALEKIQHPGTTEYQTSEAELLSLIQEQIFVLRNSPEKYQNFINGIDLKNIKAENYSARAAHVLNALGISNHEVLKELPFVKFLTAHFELVALREKFYAEYPNATAKDEKLFLKNHPEYQQAFNAIKTAHADAMRPNYDQKLSAQRNFSYALLLYSGGFSLVPQQGKERGNAIQQAYEIFYKLAQQGYAPAIYWTAYIQQHHGSVSKQGIFFNGHEIHIKNARDSGYPMSWLALAEECINALENNQPLPTDHQEVLENLAELHNTGHALAKSLIAKLEDLSKKSSDAKYANQIVKNKVLNTANNLEKNLNQRINAELGIKVLQNKIREYQALEKVLAKNVNRYTDILKVFFNNREAIQEIANRTNQKDLPNDQAQRDINNFNVLNSEIENAITTDLSSDPVLIAYQEFLKLDTAAQLHDAIKNHPDKIPDHIILGMESKNLGINLFAPIGATLGALGGAALGTLIFPGVGTIVGGIIGGLIGGIATGYAGSKILPPITRWVAEKFDSYQTPDALSVKRVGIQTAGLGTILGGIIGGIVGTFIPIPVIGTLIGATIGSAVGAILFGSIGASSAHFANKYTGAKSNTMMMGAMGATMGAVVGLVIGSILFPGIGTAIGAGIGAILGGGLGAGITAWRNKKRGENLTEMDIQKDMLTGVATASGVISGSFLGNYLTPTLSAIPVVGTGLAAATPLVTGLLVGAVSGGVSRGAINNAEKNTPLTEAPKLGFVSEASHEAMTGLSYSPNIVGGIAGVLSNLGQTIGNFLTPIAGVLGHLGGLIKTKIFSSHSPEKMSTSLPKVIFNTHSPFEGLFSPPQAETASPPHSPVPSRPSTPQGMADLAIEHSTITSFLNLHRNDLWVYRDKSANIALPKPLLDLLDVNKIPGYQSSHLGITETKHEYIVMTLTDKSQLVIYPHEILLLGTAGKETQTACAEIAKQLGWDSEQIQFNVHFKNDLKPLDKVATPTEQSVPHIENN